MNRTIIYLIGYSGTGKYTIAKEISRLTGARLVDNQLINNPIFSVIEADGVTALPEIVWQKIELIRRVVLDVIRDISPPDLSFVLTNVLLEGCTADAVLFSQIADLALRRQSAFVPVRLLCDEEELCRRVVSADRVERYKAMSAENARAVFRSQEILKIDHPNVLSLDVTKLSPERAAKEIIRHASAALKQASNDSAP